MTELPEDRWAAGDAYERYMGRWSRTLASSFLTWLRPPPGAHWLEVGCGTGALTAAICTSYEPASVQACDPSEAFIEHARRHSSGVCTFSVIPSANAFPVHSGGFDAVVSGLVLTFVPNPELAVMAMRERARADGTVAAYVWDYAGGVEFLRYFWEEAVAIDERAAPLDESRRFGAWDQPALASLFRAAGLCAVATDTLEIATDFQSFDDYWQPFLGGSGPAPSYVSSLDASQREALRARLERRVPRDHDGRVRLRARASAVRGIVPG
jgi:SAM-dependent methyltransferase